MSYLSKHLAFLTVMAMAIFSGCANYEVNTKRGTIQGYYIRYEMQGADRAMEAARQAGKDKLCPAEFKAAESAKDNAYDVFRACNTEEGVSLAKKATAMANALCPPQPLKAEPAPVIVPVAKGSLVPSAAAEPVDASPASRLTIKPDSIKRGETTQLAWTSHNATDCSIQPRIGQVQTQGSLSIMPVENTTYTLSCNGGGGRSDSTATITIYAPPKKSPVSSKNAERFVRQSVESHSKKQVSRELNDDMALLARRETYLNGLKKASYTFNTPSPIKVAKPVTVYFWIDPQVEPMRLAKELKGKLLEMRPGEKPQTEAGQMDWSPKMRVTLTGDDFDITPTKGKSFDGIKDLSTTQRTEWSWDVTAKKVGEKLPLHIQVSAVLPKELGEPDVLKLDRLIQVKVTWFWLLDNFWEKYWKWLLGGLGAALASAIAAWWKYRHPNTTVG